MIESLESVARVIFAILITGLWQGALLAGVAWLVMRSARGMNATTRHAVLASALFACLALPVVTVALTFESTGAQTATASSPAPGGTNARVIQTLTHSPTTKHATTSSPQQAQAGPVAGLPTFARTRFTLPRLLVVALVAAWLLGALVVLARLVVSLVHLERLKRDALPLPVEYRQRLDRWTGAAKGSRDVRLCRSGEIVIPIAVGLFDAMILVPEQLVEELAPEDVDRILLHELAHLRRADDWFNAVERIAQALLFFNPGVQWIVKPLDLEREVACDDWVLAQTDEPLPYATCLAKVAEVTMWPYRAMAAPGAFVTRKSMSIRIERLLAVHRDVRIRLSYGPIGTAAIALIALCIGAAYVAPSIAYPLAAIVAPVSPAASAKPAPIVKAAPSTKAAPLAIARVRTDVQMQVTQHVQARTSSQAVEAPKVSAILADTTARASYIDQLASAGYTNLSLDDLMQLKSLDVTGEYIRSLASVGFSHPTVRELEEARSLGVTADYIRGLRSYFGSSSFSLRDVGEIRSVGVTPEYATGLASAGYPNLSMRDLEEAKSLGVTADYVREVHAYFGTAASIRDIEQYRALGVTTSYAKDMASAGYPSLKMSDLEQLKALDIDPAFVRSAEAHGFHNLTLKQLIDLKVSGIL